MKITDESKEFISKHRFGTDKLRLGVSSNYPGEHETPSLFLRIYDPADGEEVSFGTKDTEQIKEIIEHMAKMSGLDVTFSKRFEPQYQPGDRVRSTHPDNAGETATVLWDKHHPRGWNVRVRMDDDNSTGLFMYEELEPVTKSSN